MTCIKKDARFHIRAPVERHGGAGRAVHLDRKSAKILEPFLAKPHNEADDAIGSIDRIYRALLGEFSGLVKKEERFQATTLGDSGHRS